MKRQQIIFWSRIVTTIVFGGIIPFLYLVIKFDLFKKVNSVNIGGWGIIAIIFGAIFLITMLVMVKKGIFNPYIKHIINGIMFLEIPLIVVSLILNSCINSIEQLSTFFWILVICEPIAIIANPLPQWAFDNKIKYEDGKFVRFAKTLWSEQPQDNKTK